MVINIWIDILESERLEIYDLLFFPLSLCIKVCLYIVFLICHFFLQKQSSACVDPESFIRSGPILTTFFYFLFLVGEGRGGMIKKHYKQAIIVPSANGVLLVGR